MNAAPEVWYASVEVESVKGPIRFQRIAIGAKQALDMLRDAEQRAVARIQNPDLPQLTVYVDQPGSLFADEDCGRLVQARASSLTRTGRRNGVVLELRW